MENKEGGFETRLYESRMQHGRGQHRPYKSGCDVRRN
jgi:hypothetical protein